jgi:hypothetical protein
MARACAGPIRAAVGDNFSDEEIEDLVGRLAARAKRLGLSDPNISEAEALKKAAAELTAEELKGKLIAKRMETFAALAREKRGGRFKQPVSMLGKTLQDLNVGSSRQGALVGLSVDARGRAYADSWRGELVRDLEGIEGALPRLQNWLGGADKEFEADVARELGRLNDPQGKAKPSADPAATQVATAMKAAQDKAMKALNDRGAWIGKMPGYVTKQNHDVIKVSGGFSKGWTPGTQLAAENSAEWIKAIGPLLDDRTFEVADEIRLRDLERETAQITNQRIAEDGWGTVELDREQALKDMGHDTLEDYLADGRTNMLQQVWKDIVLGKSADDGADLSDLAGFTPPPGTARQVSKARVLHFKSPDDWIKYHSTYGSGSFLETFMLGIEGSAKNAALLETWGPNPKAAFDAERKRLGARAEKAGDVKAYQEIMDPGREREFAMLDGSASAPRGGLEARIALIGQGLRTQQSLAKLGGMTVTSISDLGSAATALMRAGVPIFSAYKELLTGVTRTAGADAAHIGDLVNVTSRAIAGDIAGNFAAMDSPVGLLSKAQRVFYKVNLFDMWQTGVRRGASTALARLLGGRADRAFADLGDGVGEQLRRFGVDAGLWDLVRKHATEMEGEAGRFITPDAAGKITPDEAVKWLNPPKVRDKPAIAAARIKLKDALANAGIAEGSTLGAWTHLDRDVQATLKQGGFTRALWERIRDHANLDKVTDRSIAKDLKIPDIWTPSQKQSASEEAQLRMQAWFSGFVDDATTEPRAAEQAILTWGQRDGTAMGTTMRMLTQFKSFPLSMITRNILPTLREANTSLAAIQAGKAGMEALGRPAMLMANTMVGLTMLGYVAGAARDLMAGKDPRPVDRPETWLAAFVQGGGAGFYGDFLFAQYNRFGQGPLSALAGPTVGTAEQLLSLYGKLREGDDVGAKAVQLGISNVPFANLFYLRAALNYSMLYSLQEAASPGYLARMEQRMQEQEGRGFAIAPPQLEASQGAASGE